MGVLDPGIDPGEKENNAVLRPYLASDARRDLIGVNTL